MDLDFLIEMTTQDTVYEFGNTAAGQNAMQKLKDKRLRQTEDAMKNGSYEDVVKAHSRLVKTDDRIIATNKRLRKNNKARQKAEEAEEKKDAHPIVSPASSNKSGMSWKKKAAIGAGVGLAAYGAYRYMKK